ncbi:Z-ring formation inhibitor MciZ [Bacillus fonticola]|uniref:Z-ring formation inhibitor MciZ n=1 Tax=Bacillus fonticola TaxID=2728853 RepID=UPI00147494BF
MKVYIHEKGVVLAGKAWQIRHLLQQYRRQYNTVDEWIKGRKEDIRTNELPTTQQGSYTVLTGGAAKWTKSD